MARSQLKIKVRERTFRERVRYNLEKQGRAIRRAGGKDILLDVAHGKVIAEDFNAEKWAREVGILKPYEEVV